MAPLYDIIFSRSFTTCHSQLNVRRGIACRFVCGSEFFVLFVFVCAFWFVFEIFFCLMVFVIFFSFFFFLQFFFSEIVSNSPLIVKAILHLIRAHGHISCGHRQSSLLVGMT